MTALAHELFSGSCCPHPLYNSVYANSSACANVAGLVQMQGSGCLQPKEGAGLQRKLQVRGGAKHYTLHGFHLQSHGHKEERRTASSTCAFPKVSTGTGT